MTDLTTRLREGSGPDRELDDDLARHFGPPPPEIGGYYGWEKWGPGSYAKPINSEGSRFDTWTAPAYTASLDAVFALVEREGFRWLRIEGVRKDEGYLAIIETSEISQVFEIGNDRCRALLLALIAAKEPKP